MKNKPMIMTIHTVFLASFSFVLLFWPAGEASYPDALVKQAMNMQDNEQKIDLPEPDLRGDVSVEEALHSRRSVRDFRSEPLTLSGVGQVLWAAYGITEPRPGGPSYLRGGFRTAPSAGALYPLELYLVAGNVNGLQPGIYRYNPEDHSLDLMSTGDSREELSEAALGQEFIEEAPASIVITAVYERTTQKYGQRGSERYVCMDAGHSAQNIYLQATALGLGTCAVGAFTDKMVEMVMMLPGKETPLYIMPLGKIED